MTGRERLQAVLAKQPTDRLPWTTLVDEPSLALAPAELRNSGGIDFYRDLGCDVFLLNGWNLPHHFESPSFSWGAQVRVEHRTEGREHTRIWHSPWGALTSVHGHPTATDQSALDDCVGLLRGYHVGRAPWMESISTGRVP